MPERHRDRQLLLDQLQHADVAEIALAEIEPREIPQHQREAFRRRLVETELLFKALDEFGIEPLRAAVLRSDGIGRRADLAAGAEIAAAEPEIREVPPVSAPLSCAITRSTGPPGANCTTTNDTNMIPSSVGIISKCGGRCRRS
jgi:hypothetical protein